MLSTEDYIKYKLIEEDIERSSSNDSGGSYHNSGGSHHDSGGSNDNSGCGIFILIFIVLALFGWLFS